MTAVTELVAIAVRSAAETAFVPDFGPGWDKGVPACRHHKQCPLIALQAADPPRVGKNSKEHDRRTRPKFAPERPLKTPGA